MASEHIAHVNVSAANMYREPAFRSEICSQAVLWERVVFMERNNGFARVVSEDSYTGWIAENQLISNAENDMVSLEMVTPQSAALTAGKNLGAQTVRTVSAGGYLQVVSRKENSIEVRFPDGRTGWTGNTRIFDRPELSRSGVTGLVRSYLGLPYFWGGKTPSGIDCSGLTQLTFKLCGLGIPRDAHDQCEEAAKVSDEPLGATPGDLLFFSENSGVITHVGMSLGDDTVIHCRGMVGINSLRPGSPDFRHELLDAFVCVKSFF